MLRWGGFLNRTGVPLVETLCRHSGARAL